MAAIAGWPIDDIDERVIRRMTTRAIGSYQQIGRIKIIPYPGEQAPFVVKVTDDGLTAYVIP